MMTAVDLIKNAARGKSRQDKDPGYGPGKTRPATKTENILRNRADEAVETARAAKIAEAVKVTEAARIARIAEAAKAAKEAKAAKAAKVARNKKAGKYGAGALALGGAAYGATKMFGSDNINKTPKG